MRNSADIATAAILTVALAGPAAAAPDPLVVGPGTIGTTQMGVSLKRAQEQGWIAPAVLCRGWTAGPKAVRVDRFGEVYKAFPDRVTKRRLLSMWATGHVVTARGIRSQGLGTRAQPGSSVISLREAYPTLRKYGRLRVNGRLVTVYSIGGRSGFLDFHVADGRVSSMVVRTPGVSWKRVPASGC